MTKLEEIRIRENGDAVIRFGDRSGHLVNARAIETPYIVVDYNNPERSIRAPIEEIQAIRPGDANAFALGQSFSMGLSRHHLEIYAVQFYKISERK